MKSKSKMRYHGCSGMHLQSFGFLKQMLSWGEPNYGITGSIAFVIVVQGIILVVISVDRLYCQFINLGYFCAWNM